MKHTIKLFEAIRSIAAIRGIVIIAVAAVIGFSMAGCGGDDDGGGEVNATLIIVNNYTASITKVEVTNYGGSNFEDTTVILNTEGSNSKTLAIPMNKPEDYGWWGVTLYASGLESVSGSIWVENGKTTTVTLNNSGTLTVKNPD